MTTRIRLTNLGPGNVNVIATGHQEPFILKPGQETEAYVYGEQLQYYTVAEVKDS